MDKEFDKIKHKITGVSINTAAPGEHVGEIERAHQDIKNRCRAVLSLLPYDYYHRQIIIHLVKFVVMMINCVPSKLGITQQMSPRELVTQLKLDCATQCPYSFWLLRYIEASEDPNYLMRKLMTVMMMKTMTPVRKTYVNMDVDIDHQTPRLSSALLSIISHMTLVV